jgi:aspartate/methionine/tyrosine aminotransferase
MGIQVDYEDFQRKKQSLKGALRRTIAETYDVSESNVLATCSGSEALFLAIGSTIKMGDKVLVTTPNYPPTFKLPKLFGAAVKLIPSRMKDGFQPDVRKLSETHGSRTKAVVLTNPNNPAGCKIRQEALVEILESARRSKVIVDEAFREFGFENATPIAATLGENAISLGTMSKFYGLEDLRIGWIIAKKEIVDRAKKLKDWVTIDNSVFSEMLACKVLEGRESFVKRAREFYDRNVELVQRWIGTRRDLEWIKPDAGLICFPKYNLPVTSLELAKKLSAEYGVAVSPGSYFNRDHHFRLCFTRTHGELEEALQALGHGLDLVAKSNPAT